ncbi:MAG: redoxin domain-containing protein [Candidatus Latescibacteria bacterium]|nr:redoxin domain-containing protein [Candidatus Latescibacterota bacterium]
MFKYVMTLIFLLLPVYVHAAPTAADCDFNNSGKVDFADFVAFSQGYGTTQTQFDLNGDGAVDFRDFVIFAQFYGQTITTPPPTTDAPVEAPDFTLRTLAGESFNLYAQRGKPVFLNFWGTWCPPCVAEMPAIQKLQDTMGDSIQIVGIGVRDTRIQELRFITRYGYTWTFVLDSTGEARNAYEVSSYPTSLFLDAKGVIVRVLRSGRNYETFLEAARQAINN